MSAYFPDVTTVSSPGVLTVRGSPSYLKEESYAMSRLLISVPSGVFAQVLTDS